jgi:glycosyltransferase involved in cell wall biosynthesis
VQSLGQASPLTGHVRRQFDIQPGDVVIGHVANFRRNKNHMFLLRAFHEIARRRRGVKLLLVGQGFEGDPENSEPEVRAYVRGHGLTDVVKLAGYQKNVRDLFAVMDISCLVSYNEGLPLSLIEAMASGLPVVGTDIEGIRTVVETGVNGVLVQPDDVDGLARALERLIDDPAGRCAMGARAQSLASSRYTLERCVAQTQEMLMPGPATHLRD